MEAQMVNEAIFSVAGFVATKPYFSATKTGLPTLTMRLAWTPRRIDRATGEWTDEPTCFVSVRCFGKTAENCRFSLDKGDPVVVTGTLKMHDYQAKDGTQRTNVDITAASIGHDLSRGVTAFRRLRPKDESSSEDHQAEAGADGSEPAEGAVPGSTSAAAEAAEDELVDIRPADDDPESVAEIEEAMQPADEPVAASF
jgi:single-strand DNA-binding protein